MTVKGDEEHPNAHEKTSFADMEKEIVQAQQPLSEKEQDEENAAIGAISDGEESKLPFSKARCIALVVTVTCAAFINVKLLLRICLCSKMLIKVDFGHSSFRYHSAHYRPSIGHPRLAPTMDSLLVQLDLRLLPAPLGPSC
jgi:hypothetical protein